MEKRVQKKTVKSLRLANVLLSQGHKLIDVKKSVEIPGILLFNFSYTDELKLSIDEYIERSK